LSPRGAFLNPLGRCIYLGAFDVFQTKLGSLGAGEKFKVTDTTFFSKPSRGPCLIQILKRNFGLRRIASLPQHSSVN
jgi:hypothetical protein